MPSTPTTEHTVPYLAEINHSWIDYLNDDPASDEHKEAMAKALFDEKHTRFNAWLPDGFFWTPQTSSIIGPRDRFHEIPDLDTIEEAMDSIVQDIETDYQEIEERVVYRLAAERLPELPQPIKPRTLAIDRTGRADFITSDGKYRISRYGLQAWNAERNDGTKDSPRWALAMQMRGTLDDMRQEYCTPASRMPWIVADMDMGVLRIAPTRKAARDWAERHAGAPLRSMNHAKGSTCWDYSFGYRDEDSNECFSIMRADNARLHGFKAEQEPYYPYAEDPHTAGPRGEVYGYYH